MIAVIADDLTGAAEIGGIGLDFGLTVEIHTGVPHNSNAELLVISTDSRSMSKYEAVEITKQVIKALLALKPTFIYKKIDSALRGHILAEIEVQLEETKLKKAIIVGGNPDSGRLIIDGHYYINGVPIHETAFANDPEFPALGSGVWGLLLQGLTPPPAPPHTGRGVSHQSIFSIEKVITKNSLRRTHPLPVWGGGRGVGFHVPNITSKNDLKTIAENLQNDTLVAGSAVLFEAILETKYSKAESEAFRWCDFGASRLYVCGTAFAKRVEAVATLYRQGEPVFYLGETKNWIQNARKSFEKHGWGIVAIDKTTLNPKQLRQKMAEDVAKLLTKIEVSELLIEGGSTATSLLKQFDIQALIPKQKLTNGVIRCQAAGRPNLHITLKPGSYDWPPQIDLKPCQLLL